MKLKTPPKRLLDSDTNTLISGAGSASTLDSRPATSFEWLEQAVKTHEAGRKVASLDLVFDHIDDLLLEGQFSDVDYLLQIVSPERLPYDIMLALLTTTRAARKQLRTRPHFYAAAWHHLDRTGESADQLLAGLG